MKKALVITSHVEHLHAVCLNHSSFDTVICADGGFLIAQQLKIVPDILIGDYDSSSRPELPDIILLPMEKDMTDSEAAIDLAVSKGFSHITVLGGLGGRLDHTMGNLGMLAKYCGKLEHLAFTDGQNYVFMIEPGRTVIPKNTYRYMGIISYGLQAKNVTLRGVKYPLTNHLLTNETTLGVSNEIVKKEASVSFTEGRLLVILSDDIEKKE
ncbi:thiamine diphosphokinase [Ihubacter sp. mB4P-1]|uniref:thiamine diphosphokinase n=1 Tax=Ihubacter sp. mB4P-1 TaxID=3242370 RepID=UPI00137A3FFA